MTIDRKELLQFAISEAILVDTSKEHGGPSLDETNEWTELEVLTVKSKSCGQYLLLTECKVIDFETLGIYETVLYFPKWGDDGLFDTLTSQMEKDGYLNIEFK